MILDGHIHVTKLEGKPEDFVERLNAAGIDGGIVFSFPPHRAEKLDKPPTAEECLENVFYWTDGAEHLYPFYFIDLIAPDAAEQVARAVDRGVYGFKAACGNHDPRDERAMKTYHAIAEAEKPILFHSGIIYDGKPSSWYSRPVLFECLLDVPNIRFALAHVSWPWCDECLAVFGKFWNTNWTNKDRNIQMYIDLCVGIPPIRHRHALECAVGHPGSPDKVFFGTDNHADNYNPDTAREAAALHRKTFEEMGVDAETLEKIFSENMLRFLGVV